MGQDMAACKHMLLVHMCGGQELHAPHKTILPFSLVVWPHAGERGGPQQHPWETGLAFTAGFVGAASSRLLVGGGGGSSTQVRWV